MAYLSGKLRKLRQYYLLYYGLNLIFICLLLMSFCCSRIRSRTLRYISFVIDASFVSPNLWQFLSLSWPQHYEECWVLCRMSLINGFVWCFLVIRFEVMLYQEGYTELLCPSAPLHIVGYVMSVGITGNSPSLAKLVSAGNFHCKVFSLFLYFLPFEVNY